MGMYTSIRGVVKVKSEYISLAEHFSADNEKELENDKLKFDFVKSYFETERAEYIPSLNPLQSQFRDEEDYFIPRVKDNVFYFRADLKDYQDENTGKSPIESFMNDILSNISDEILLLETANDYNYSVNQYFFSNSTINEIEMVNITNSDKESFYGFPPEEDEDIFQEYKRKNGLDIFS